MDGRLNGKITTTVNYQQRITFGSVFFSHSACFVRIHRNIKLGRQFYFHLFMEFRLYPFLYTYPDLRRHLQHISD